MTSGDRTQLFIITASNAHAKRNVQVSIARPIDPNVCANHFTPAFLNHVGSHSGDGQLYAWGQFLVHAIQATGISSSRVTMCSSIKRRPIPT
jgi:hypothetical protein